MIKTQHCPCGSDHYQIHLVVRDNRNALVVACVECGRITSSVGDGEYRGMTIDELEE